MGHQNDDAIGPDGPAVYHTKCPRGHDVSVYYTPAEWVAGLTTSTLTLPCSQCDEQFHFSQQDRDQLLAEFRARGLA